MAKTPVFMVKIGCRQKSAKTHSLDKHVDIEPVHVVFRRRCDRSQRFRCHQLSWDPILKNHLRGRHPLVYLAAKAVGPNTCGSLRGNMAENSDSMLIRGLAIGVASADGAFTVSRSAFAKMRGGGQPF